MFLNLGVAGVNFPLKKKEWKIALLEHFRRRNLKIFVKHGEGKEREKEVFLKNEKSV